MTRPALFTLLSVLALSPLEPVAAQDLLWVRQIGTINYDLSYGVAVDGAGNAYIAGTTRGSLGGLNAGINDAFLAKYDASGTLLWTRQVGTTFDDFGFGVAVDAAGNACITGWTSGSLGGPNAGGKDVFLARYDASGTLLWTRQIGTANRDIGLSVAVDGERNMYLSGYTNGDFGGSNAGAKDVFLAKFDEAGTLLWTRQIGTSQDDSCHGVAVDGVGNAYVSGFTYGRLGESTAGRADSFLTKFDASGTSLWTRQIGTSANDFGVGVAVDDMGNSYITGWTLGGLGGPNAGGEDAFLAKCDASGALLWTWQTGTAANDESWGVAVDRVGNAYIAGYTYGSLGGPNAGDADLFLAKLRNSLCPADFNHDGFTTGDDFDSFSLAFVSGDLAADFDGNGVVNGDDSDAYVAAFEAGC